MEILKLSYESLPAPLKPCFAFLSFFPEDEIIYPQYLINLWITEGFIPAGKDQLEIGWNYIYNLHNLCLLEVLESDSYQETKWCKIHDLLLDLAISISKESQCAFIVEEAFNKETGSSCRSILLGKKSTDDDIIASSSASYFSPCLRTLSLSQNDGIQYIPANLFTGLTVLRILDLSSTRISALPTCIGNLKLLTVMNLSETQIQEVPECVRSIKSLQFLDISWCEILQHLPVWIGELNCLEYLDIRGCTDQCVSSIPKEISMLVLLQALRSHGLRLSINEENQLLNLEHVVNLINLREVWMHVHDVRDLRRIEEGILAHLVNMRTLAISNDVEIIKHVDESDLPSLSEKMLAMKDLEILYLEHFAVPVWVCGFSNLVQLELRNCHCAHYPPLEMMPNLISLEFSNNMNCSELPKGFGKPRGFPKLRHLQMSFFALLEELPELEDGAMP